MTNLVSGNIPTSSSERILALDTLRGFALLGILIMNIQSFALVEAAYTNPTAFGDLAGINRSAWVFTHILADQKFMTIFSIMFGAGIFLMTNRAEAKGYHSARLHYRRTLSLLIIGLLHAHLLWSGDILVTYALCALIVYLFRKISPKKLLVFGLLLISVPSIIYFNLGRSIPSLSPEAYQSALNNWQPTSAMISKEISAYRGNWLEQMAYRIPASRYSQTSLFQMWFGWRAGGLMLIGLSLYQWGILTAQRSRRFYIALASVGFGLGLPLVIYGMVSNFAANWSFDYSTCFGWQYNYWGSLPVSMGYIGLIMLLCQSPIAHKLARRLSAVGQMSLTNYLLQSLICTTIFYGHGFGLFGQVERGTLLLIVLCVWAFQLWVSPIWLRNFRFGPVEWLWRSFTYLKIQPMRLDKPYLLPD
jgi:uncharacterized protein